MSGSATEARVVPAATQMTANPFLGVAFFNHQPTLRTAFPMLVLVAQFAAVGIERMMSGYF
jgi:hypothetical protein